MFGDFLMICPVTNPMYYGVDSVALEEVDKTRPVYLPEGLWYDFYTNKLYDGDCWIEADADIDRIPVFVKAGAILPMAEAADSTAAQNGIAEIRVYAGADGKFVYYNDAGDGYAYEQGEYECVTLTWDDKAEKLTVPEKWKNVKVRVV